MKWSRVALVTLSSALVPALGACTPGAFATAGTQSAPAPAGRAPRSIDVDLTLDPSGATPGGTGGGYAPLVTMLGVGDSVRFVNSDGFAHTATSIAGSSFPSAYPFTNAALTQNGATLSGGFSTGSLAAGASSQVLLADKSGTYLFGCFYHYGSPMRASIDVR